MTKGRSRPAGSQPKTSGHAHATLLAKSLFVFIRAQNLEKTRKVSDKAHEEEAKNAKRRNGVVEVVTRVVTLLETTAARGLGTVEFLHVKDVKAMLHHDDQEVLEAKGKKADLMD
jgi:hypothetical protein